MAIRATSAALVGIEAKKVEVEVDFSSGLPAFFIVGLPDTAVRESKDRVKSAIKNSGFTFPMKRITVNLAPADLRKEGGGFDLPVAVGILRMQQVIPFTNTFESHAFIGELSLDGKIKGTKGLLAIAAGLKKLGIKGIFCARSCAPEAALVRGLEVIGVTDLADVVQILRGESRPAPTEVDLEKLWHSNRKNDVDMSEVCGQEHAKRAMEIAAAGGHNMLMIGPPGSGKTMLARRLATILPDPTWREALESTMIHSVAGNLNGNILLTTRPYAAPHHSISDVGLVGGGAYPKPGQISLAHNGILFLDELSEFKRAALEVMRQPLEDGHVNIARSMINVTFPSKFMLIAAMNPCPCGYLGDPNHECRCSSLQIDRYRHRISGPLLDRIDIHVEVPAVKYKELATGHGGESSKEIKQRVDQCRKTQLQRFKGSSVRCNAQMNSRQIRQICRLDPDGHRLMEMVVDRLGFSARAYARILKVARTIADMDGSPIIRSPHLSEAVQYRSLDRNIQNSAA